MRRFTVWAPNAERVDLVRGGERVAMSCGERGWWVVDVADAAVGDEYAFSLDGGEARPDPRSMDQPHGVHGASRLVDHSAYAWRFPRFCAPPLSSAVIYEMHVGTFTRAGTLDAAIDRLDHLVNVGITHVEVMPLNAFDGAHGWGYDGVCWFAPHRAYTGDAGPDAVKRFVDACHERGLAVLLDAVFNHLGPSGNYLHEFGPYFSDEYDTPWGWAINLDGAGSDEVRRLICDAALYWLREYHFDGLRLDAVHAFLDRSAVHLLEQMSREVRALEAEVGRPLVLVAESDLNDPRVVTPCEANGLGMTAQWSDDFHHALHAVLTGEEHGYYADFGSIGQLAKSLTDVFVYDGAYSGNRGRRHGRPVGDVSGSCFVGYAQNHDQVGNRAAGSRLSTLVSAESLKTAAALVLLSPYVPMLFQGEEWGTTRPFQFFTDHRDAKLAESVRHGRRNEFKSFGWKPGEVPDPQSVATFERSQLHWDELGEPQHTELLAWYRALISLRRSCPALTDGRRDRVRVAFDEEGRWLAMRRGGVVLVCSFSREPVVIAGSELPGGAAKRLVMASSSVCRVEAGVVQLSPGGCVVLEVDGCGC